MNKLDKSNTTGFIDSTRKGKAILTYKGRYFWPLDPREEDVDIEDIAHSLSLQCRYNGHCKVFFSVSEHCVRVSKVVSPENALCGLLHDASEAYLSDIPSPIKGDMPEYLAYEKNVQTIIYSKYKIYEEPIDVKRADRVLLITEMRDLMNTEINDPDFKALDTIIVPASPDEAKKMFLNRFNELLVQK